jgi:transcription termination factor Rho
VVDAAECSVTCPWHFGKFDLRTGAAIDGVVRKPVETYRVEVRNGVVYVGPPERRSDGAAERRTDGQDGQNGRAP